MRRVYVGTGAAEKAVKIYVPVLKKKPVHIDTSVTADNIMGLFGVVSGTWEFVGNGAEFSANNIGVVSSAASTELTALMQMHSISFAWLINAEDPYDRFTVAVNGDTVLDVTGVQSGTWSGSLNQGDKITFIYTKDVYGDAEGEYAIWKDMVCTVDSSEEFVDEYKARRVLKGYVGDENGEARLCFGKRTVSYNGVVANVVRVIQQTAAENKAAVLFSGGCRKWSEEEEYEKVNAFDSRLTKVDAASLPYATYDHSGATAGDGDYAVFAGGRGGNEKSVCAYDEHLTQSILTSLYAGCFGMTSASFNGCAVFAGGLNVFAVEDSEYVQYFDENLSFHHTTLSVGRRGMVSAEVGGKLLLGGGYNPGSSNKATAAVDVFDENFTRTTTELSAGRYRHTGGAVDGYALFVGGYTDMGEIMTRVDAFDEDLTRCERESIFAIPQVNGTLKAKTIHGMLLVTNGTNMEVWDDTLTALDAGDAEVPRLYGFDVGVINDYMLISCGNKEAGRDSSDVEPRIISYKVK